MLTRLWLSYHWGLSKCSILVMIRAQSGSVFGGQPWPDSLRGWHLYLVPLAVPGNLWDEHWFFLPVITSSHGLS